MGIRMDVGHLFSHFCGGGGGGWVWFWGKGFVMVAFRLKDYPSEGYKVEMRVEEAQILLQAFFPLEMGEGGEVVGEGGRGEEGGGRGGGEGEVRKRGVVYEA